MAWLLMLALAGTGYIGGPDRPGLPVPIDQERAEQTLGGDFPSIVGLFSTDDYPAEALRKDEQGTVAVNVVLRDDGRVKRCDVTTSSGSASLDEATCSIIKERGNFPPIRDRSGVVKNDYTARIRWMLPDAGPQAFEERRIAIVFSIDRSGTLAKCRLEGSLPLPKAEYSCSSFQARAGPDLARLARYDANMTDREIVIEQGLKIGGRDAADGVGSASGEMLISHSAFSLSVDAGGDVVDCRATAPRNLLETSKVCDLESQGTFAPLGAEAANQTLRSAVRYFVTFTRPAREK
jgi:TonB family protein